MIIKSILRFKKVFEVIYLTWWFKTNYLASKLDISAVFSFVSVFIAVNESFLEESIYTVVIISYTICHVNSLFSV